MRSIREIEEELRRRGLPPLVDFPRLIIHLVEPYRSKVICELFEITYDLPAGSVEPV